MSSAVSASSTGEQDDRPAGDGAPDVAIDADRSHWRLRWMTARMVWFVEWSAREALQRGDTPGRSTLQCIKTSMLTAVATPDRAEKVDGNTDGVAGSAVEVNRIRRHRSASGLTPKGGSGNSNSRRR